MRVSQVHIRTLKEDPSEAEIVSHKLMLRTGMIRRLTSGIFTWMPIGLRVLRKVEAIVREEMNAIGAQELLMPAVQPAELWQESGRWDKYGPLLLRAKDRHERDYCVGPTHEEVISDVARRELRSYKDLPTSFYQIQTKFRDEIRPRFGVMRSREFIMKDAYSFDLDEDKMAASYDAMSLAYHRAFERMGLKFRAVDADSGEIGGARSEEFHVLAESGEDAIAYCDADNYAANVELTPAPEPDTRPEPSAAIARVETPGAKTIEDAANALNLPVDKVVKTLILAGTDSPVAVVLRGDHTLNAVKASKHPLIATPLTMLEPGDVVKATGAPPGSVGPMGLDIPVIVDNAAWGLADFACGANEKFVHLTGVNWGRDADPGSMPFDLRNVVEGDPSPRGGGTLSIARGIEVGHIFQLGRKYSEAMDVSVQDESGQSVAPFMGCYGIGITRIVGAAIEQNHDDNGIIWPEPLAPWSVVIVPINAHRSDAVKDAAESLYQTLLEAGVDVLIDDRDSRPGAKFADAELLGIPHRVVIGDRGLADGDFEYQYRRKGEREMLKRDAILSRLGVE
ncbi:MAG: proline--tRNA ligase [Pseudomonadota bacterium]